MMTCDDRDSDLLLMAHGELGPVRQARTRLHVQRCPRCRKRIGEFNLVSAAFAATLGPTAAERPLTPSARPTSTAPTSGSLLVILGLLAVIGGALFFVIRSAVSLAPQPQYYSYTPPSTPHGMAIPIRHGIPGCKPGIVSDKCR